MWSTERLTSSELDQLERELAAERARRASGKCVIDEWAAPPFLKTSANSNGGAAGRALTLREHVALSAREPVEEISLENIDAVMQYQPWDADQNAAGDAVREALTAAAKALLREVPRSPRRTLALQHLVSARMDANAAISHRGRF